MRKGPTINLAIGPMCPVRCEGCYAHFGNTFSLGGLITSADVVAFAKAAQAEGVSQATLSGGDPLFHPEVVLISSGLKALGLIVKIDTVGTALLDSTRVIFKGRGQVAKVDLDDIRPHVDFVSIPLDGSRQETVEKFRRGRGNLFAETQAVAHLLRESGVAFGLNTVANASNFNELMAIRDIAVEWGASEWQIFEYDPTGPNPTNHKTRLRLAPGRFAEYTHGLGPTYGHLRIATKSLKDRVGAYFLIDDSGQAWKPCGDGLRHELGHITRDRDLVLSALRRHLAELQHAVSNRTDDYRDS